ncbi:TPA: BPSS1780 family membrane protein [Neisseria bacilliformis]
MNQYDPSSFQSAPPPSAPPVRQPPRLLAEPRKVAWGEGASWIGRAWRMFMLRPWLWIGMVFVMFLIQMALSLIPFVSIVANLLPLFFVGGFMLSCDALQEGGELEFGYLFSGFKYKFNELAVLTLLYILFVFVAVIVAGILLAVFAAGMDWNEFSAAIRNSGAPDMSFVLLMVLFGLIVLLFVIPLVMMVWFAPVLITLHDVPPFEAMKMSFKGCLRNMGAFVVNALVWLGAGIVVGLVFVLLAVLFAGGVSGLGSDTGGVVVGLLVLLMIPLWLVATVITQISYYTAYRSIWTDPPLKN